jgi:hypothetical protein
MIELGEAWLLVGRQLCRRAHLSSGVFQLSSRFNPAKFGDQGGRKFTRDGRRTYAAAQTLATRPER